MSSIRLWLIACVAVLSFATDQARATWYNENIESGADIIMMDLRWPWWPSGTYYANWNTSFNPQPNNISFYAGITSTVPDAPGSLPNLDEARQSTFRPGNVWSFWGGDKSGSPVRFTNVAPNLFIKNEYGGEGLSGTVGSEVWPFIERQQWYTMVGRVWQPVQKTGEPADHAFVGRWIKEVANGKWHLIGIARLPIAATSFRGNSGFIEPLTSENTVRPLQRRFGYFRKDGQWQSSNRITFNKSPYVVANVIAEGEHEYAAIEYSQKPNLLPQQLTGKPLATTEDQNITVRQPARPTLDLPRVTNVQAEQLAQQIVVSWEIPEKSSPAFAYKIEVFDNSACQGKPTEVNEVRMPAVTQALIATKVKTPTIRLTISDIFDQEAPAVIVAVRTAAPASPATMLPNSIAGLDYELFHQDQKRKENYFNPPSQSPNEEHYWLKLSELEKSQPIRRGLARGFDLSVRENRERGYALTFQGYLRVPTTGLYKFAAQIDGGYRIQIDESGVLLRDGQQGTTETTAVRALSAGDHPLSVTYMYDALSAKNFQLEWEGPGFTRRPIPLDALRVADSGTYPQVSISSQPSGNGTGRVRVKVTEHGHKIKRTQLFLGKLQLAEAAGNALGYDGPLPRGENTFWARTHFDDGCTVDSAPTTLTVSGEPIKEPWTLRNVSDAKASAGVWQTGERSFQFFGAGMHTVSRKITGDFTATCRIESYAGAHGEPVNSRAWVGVAAMEQGERLDWNWGQFFYVVQTARDGIRSSAENSDLGAGRISSYELPKGHPWLRIVRHGLIWTAWSSADGKQWQLGAYQFKKTAPTMDVGLFFSAQAQNARAHYTAQVTDFSVVTGAAADSLPPLPIAAQYTAGERLTGVVMAKSDPQVVVVRSTARGLLRTTDGGQTWNAANGELTGNDLAVRSVAIHPSDPLTMIRATGRGSEGRLWKTTDGGAKWKRLAIEIDFDGIGPSALCGEVIAFDLRNHATIYVGGESRGFFKSTDGGDSWNNLGLKGERITAIVVWAWEQYYPAAAHGKTHLCVTTCADKWMPYLGRGKPVVATTARTSKSYVSNDSVATLKLADERADTGFFNVVFEKATQTVNEMRYATVRGYDIQISPGQHMALFPEPMHLETMRPLTAIAAVAQGEQKFGRILTQALDPAKPGRLSKSERWGLEFSWLPTHGDVPRGGLISVSGDQRDGKLWWFVFTDGLHHSKDGGHSVRKVLDDAGNPLDSAKDISSKTSHDNSLAE